MVRVLGIGTERGLCSAALYLDGAVQERVHQLERVHNEHILKLIDEVVAAAGLRPQQLDAVAFGCGPGSFTGIRLAASVAQAAALGAGAKVLPVSSSLALAAAGLERMTRGLGPAGLMVSIRSRRDAFYLASFAVKEGELHPHRPDRLFDACPDWTDFDLGWPLAGDRPPWLPAEVEVLPGIAAGAGLIARLGAAAFARGEGLAPELGLPTYVEGDSPWRPAA